MAPISFHKDDRAHGGLKDDFDGEIVVAQFEPRKGNDGTHYLAAHFGIMPDEDGEEMVNEYLSSGSLEYLWPSKDGEAPIDLKGWDGNPATLDKVSGPFLAPAVGSSTTQVRDTNFTFFMDRAALAGIDESVLRSGDLSKMVGIYGHFKRVAQPERTGVKKSSQQVEREKKYGPPTILVLSEIKKKPAGARKASKPAAQSPATEAPASGGGATAVAAQTNGSADLNARVSEQVLIALRAAADATLDLQTLGTNVVKSGAFSGSEKVKAMKLAADGEVLNGIPGVVYDDSTEIVRLIE